MNLDIKGQTATRARQGNALPRVSIIIPSYNHERFVSRAIESALAQTYQDFEIVITDDASTDGSVDILSSYARQDPRIKLFLNRFNYETHAINHCIQQSSGDYIAILSSDDEFFPAKLERQVDFLDRRPDVAAVFTQARIVDEQNRDLPESSHFYSTIFQQPNRSRHEWLRRFYFEGNCLCHPSVLIRRSVYDTLGVYNPLMGALDDLDMWVRICLHHEIHVLGDALVNFRVRDSDANVSADTPENFRRGQFEMIKILDHFVSPDALAQLHLIFPEFANQLAGASDAVKRHVLADTALATGGLSHRYWGIDLLYGLLSQPDTRRQLSHRIGRAPDVDFVKLSGALSPLTIEQRVSAQVFWPDAGTYTAVNSRSRYCPRSEWIDLRIPLPAWDTAVPLRFDPCDCPGVVKIAALRIFSQTDGRCVWSSRLEENDETLTVAGTAVRLSDPATCSILSTGNDPQLLLRGIPPLPDLPLELRVWIKLEPGLESAAREIESLRAAAVHHGATLQQLESRLDAAQTEHQRERGCLTAERDELKTLAAASGDAVTNLEGHIGTFKAAVAASHDAIAARDEAVRMLENQLEVLKTTAAEHQADVARLNAHAVALEAALAERDRTTTTLQAALAERDRTTTTLQAALAERDRTTTTLQAALAERDRTMTTLQAAVAKRDRKTKKFQAALAERDREVTTLQAALAKRDRETAKLQAAAAKRDRSTAVIVGSRSWRYTRPLRALASVWPRRRA